MCETAPRWGRSGRGFEALSLSGRGGRGPCASPHTGGGFRSLNCC